MLPLEIPITKVDAARRLVFGLATAEIADRAGEICDYASTKPLYEKWSEAISSSTGGKSLGKLRAMHGAVAAGKVTAIAFNDEAKQIEICAKVVDDAEWAKVTEGVYTGFSQGGAYARRWTDPSGAKRYTAEPREISLVDLPCLAEARFEMIKSDGSHEWRRFRDSDRDLDGARESAERLGKAGARNSAGLFDKAGARNSAADAARIQAMHDASVELGATCDAEKSLHRHEQALAKQIDGLSDQLAKSIADIADRLKAIEAQPMPLPLAMQARAVSKHADGGDERVEALLQNPDTMALLAIKLAQRQGR